MPVPIFGYAEQARIRQAAAAELARNNLMDFNRYTFPKYRPARHLYRLCEALEAVERGEVRRLIVSIPPRHGKSECVSVRFPAWFLGRNPDKRVVVSSYNMDLAQKFSRLVRGIVSDPQYEMLFGIGLAKDSRSAEAWDIGGRRGGFKAVGVGGGLTGHGANCFPAGTQVLTEIGSLDIADLFRVESCPRVLSYNHQTGALVWCRIEAVREKISDDIYEVVTRSGRILRATGNHPVYAEGRGYREVSGLLPGDRLLVVGTESPGGQNPPSLVRRLPECCSPTTPVSIDPGVLVRRVRTGSLPVYDLQVEECHNFFAEGILVHNCLLVDDPLKDRADAESQKTRDALWDWYTSTAYTRLEEDGAIVVCATRWHEDDLTGRLLRAQESDPNADQWVHLHLPALSDADEALWPQKYPKKKLYQIRQTVGSREWEALYQGRPRPSEGALFKDVWFQNLVEWREVPSDLRWYRYWDLALSTRDSACYTASVKVALGVDGTLYIADMIRKRLEWPDARKLIIETALQEPEVELGIENVAFQAIAIQELRREPRLASISMRGVKVSGDKEIRAKAWSYRAEEGKVVLVKGASIPQAVAAWIDEFVTECLSFPVGLHDDQVDTVSGGVQMISDGGPIVVTNPSRVALPRDTGGQGSEGSDVHYGHHPLHPSSPYTYPSVLDAQGRFIPPPAVPHRGLGLLQRLVPAREGPVFEETGEVAGLSMAEARTNVARHLPHLVNLEDATGAGMRQALLELRHAYGVVDPPRVQGAMLLYMVLLGTQPTVWSESQRRAFSLAAQAVNDATSDPWSAGRLLEEAGLV